MKNFYYIVNGISHWFTGTGRELAALAETLPDTAKFWEQKDGKNIPIYFVGL